MASAATRAASRSPTRAKGPQVVRQCRDDRRPRVRRFRNRTSCFVAKRRFARVARDVSRRFAPVRDEIIRVRFPAPPPREPRKLGLPFLFAPRCPSLSAISASGRWPWACGAHVTEGIARRIVLPEPCGSCLVPDRRPRSSGFLRGRVDSTQLHAESGRYVAR
jgi:hypothetical protein